MDADPTVRVGAGSRRPQPERASGARWRRHASLARCWKPAAGEIIGVIALSVLRFAQLTESRGRRFGQQLILAIGDRLGLALPHGARLATTGEDTLLVVLPGAATMLETSTQLQEWLRACAHTPIVVDGERVHFALRAGLAMHPDHGPDFATVERNALSALVEAGRRGVGVCAFRDELHRRAQRRWTIEQDLRVAIETHALDAHVQPRYAAADGRLCGAETLLRWHHPEFGSVPTAEFIPLLEETGLIATADRWVMGLALRRLARWQRRGHHDLRLAVNVSAHELRQHDFVEACQALAEAAGSDGGLDIEVTESALMSDVAVSIDVLGRLRRLGCRIAIDDFGAGYSSLSYLTRLPIDVLKLDGSFARHVVAKAAARTVVAGVADVAHALGLVVVAEHVETPAQRDILSALGCDELQGNLLGPPMPILQFERCALRSRSEAR